MNELDCQPKMMESTVEEDLFKGHGFSNNLPLMGHTKANKFSQKSVGSFICKALYMLWDLYVIDKLGHPF